MMADPALACPYAEYTDGMKIHCKKACALCGHAFFKRCKGWWALSPQAEKCPLRKCSEATEPAANTQRKEAVPLG